jgi:Family of unknown function (DUF5677)
MTLEESFKDLDDILSNGVQIFAEIAKAPAYNGETYNYCLKATVSKCFEFMLAIRSSGDIDSYVMISTLRGMCEDLIFLTFLQDNARDIADKVTFNLAMHEIYVSSEAQWNFFKHENRDEVLYYYDQISGKAKLIEKENADLFKSIGVNTRNKIKPSVRSLAEKTGLKFLYDYLYHGTSSLVHFNPRTLLRMGWGNRELTFSVTNFHLYYKDFGIFYGAYILRKILELYRNAIGDVDTDEIIESMGSFIDSRKTWPPLVTFEEMNIGTLTKLMVFKSPIDT